MFASSAFLLLLVLLLFSAFRLACQMNVRETRKERLCSICRQLFLQGLTFLGVMTFLSVLREDGCWVWWAAGFQVFAVLVSLDWESSTRLPVEVPGASVASTSLREER